ncbi:MULTISPECIES: copper chaperone PCu(A)C [unclassified Corynebacterium]|uniref:copper chaperone PCu(A)C n=1 Tax=unclassified Corynebacterium TaxID=2624378 RepID=UPI0030B3A247
MKLSRPVYAAVSGFAALSLALVGCSSDNGTEDATKTESSVAASESQASDEKAAASVTLEDGYIKEKPAEKMMTGIFGTLKNNTDKEIEVTDFYVEGLADGTVFEQHATKDGKMYKIDGGHKIPANGEHKLAPGDDHLMIMKNSEAMEQGQEFTVVIKLSDGSELTQSLPVRVQAAGEEDYAGDGSLGNPGMEDGEMKNMNMENMEHGN